MNGTRWTQVLAGLWLAGFAAGCGSDGGGPDDDLNLEEQQLTASGQRPSVDSGPDGSFAVAWLDTGSAPPKIRLQRFMDTGFKDGAVVEVGSTTGGVSLVASGPRGEIWVAWNAGHESDIRLQRYTADGSALGTASLVNPQGSLLGFDIGATGQGVALAVRCIRNCSPGGVAEFHLVATRLAADGSVSGPDAIVGSVSNASGDWFAVPAMLADGSFAVISDQTRPGGTAFHQIQRFAASGAPVGSPILLDTTYIIGIGALPGSGFVAVWGAKAGGMEGQRYSTDGTSLGGRFSVPDDVLPGEFSIGPDGSMVVMLSQGARLAARRLSADGTPQGAEIAVDSNGQSPSVALAANGRFFAAWYDHGTGGGLNGRLFAH